MLGLIYFLVVGKLYLPRRSFDELHYNTAKQEQNCTLDSSLTSSVEFLSDGL